MVRLLTWNGSAWADTRVWNGSSWRAYSPPVYGAAAWREDFNAGIPAGWWGEGYSGRTLQNWSNIHVYVDGDSSAYSSLGMKISRKDQAAGAVFASFQVAPGQTIRAQASILIQHIAGSALPANGELSLTATVSSPDISAYGTYLNSGVIYTGTVGWGWGTVTTANAFDVPARISNKPYTIEVSDFAANFWPNTGALGPFGTFRMFLDWVRFIDQNGNELMRMTTPAVEPIRVWNGSAWV